MKPFLVGKQCESKRLVKVSLKLVREIVFPVVIRDFSKIKIWKRSLKCWNREIRIPGRIWTLILARVVVRDQI